MPRQEQEQEPKEGNRISEEGTEAEAREQEEEPNTEREEIRIEPREAFGLQKKSIRSSWIECTGPTRS
jgi:hypothetical protein